VKIWIFSQKVRMQKSEISALFRHSAGEKYLSARQPTETGRVHALRVHPAGSSASDFLLMQAAF
jgi:hypothetical protein